MDTRHVIANVVLKHIGIALTLLFVPGPSVVAGQVKGDDAPRVAQTLTLKNMPCKQSNVSMSESLLVFEQEKRIYCLSCFRV